MQQLTEEEVPIATQARSTQYRLEALEHSLDTAVADIRRYRFCLEVLSFLLSIGVLYLLYLLKGDRQAVHDFVSTSATGVSLGIMVLVVVGHMSKWDEQVEKKTDISKQAHRLWMKYSSALDERPLDQKKLVRLNDGNRELLDAMKHSTAQYGGPHRRRGHQHVAMKYSSLAIRCDVCQRTWSAELARNRRRNRIIPFRGCEQCGV